MVENNAPLEDLMAAMDVVDTLRHQQGLVERELDVESRRERLLERLRGLYEAQGIEVSDQVLKEGILALEEERFQYQPVEPSFATRLANIWVSRDRWFKPVGLMAVFAIVIVVGYIFTAVLPERELRSQLPQQLQSTMTSIESIAQVPEAIANANQHLEVAEIAIRDENFDEAKSILIEMQTIQKTLQHSYSIRVVSRSNESSGIWRIPDVNSNSRNYYLIVEAVDSKNNVVELPILSEESNRTTFKKTWGLRVNEATFSEVSQDKQDDGIIQSNIVGEKEAGYLLPQYSIPTTGGKITEW